MTLHTGAIGRLPNNLEFPADSTVRRLRHSHFIILNCLSSSSALATTNDFHNHTRLGIISSKGSDNKDVVLFSEKINQKYLVLHRPRNWLAQKFGVDKPSIWIAEGNSLSNFENHILLMTPSKTGKN